MSAKLYRHFDQYDRLLYVGISTKQFTRLEKHSSKSIWFDEIARIQIEQYPTKDEAFKAEKIAIKTEKPLHNIIHADRETRHSEREVRASVNCERVSFDIYTSIISAITHCMEMDDDFNEFDFSADFGAIIANIEEVCELECKTRSPEIYNIKCAINSLASQGILVFCNTNCFLKSYKGKQYEGPTDDGSRFFII